MADRHKLGELVDLLVGNPADILDLVSASARLYPEMPPLLFSWQKLLDDAEEMVASRRPSRRAWWLTWSGVAVAAVGFATALAQPIAGTVSLIGAAASAVGGAIAIHQTGEMIYSYLDISRRLEAIRDAKRILARFAARLDSAA